MRCWGGARLLLKERRPTAYTLKADIRHYFDTIDHEILLNIIKRKIKDADLIWLINIVLRNHDSEIDGKGMPLGNLTSQFFANVYLHELDMFVKHTLKVKYYIRYVDDFIIFHNDRYQLESWKSQISDFLHYHLKIQLHPEKSKVMPLNGGVTMLGFRIFRKHRLLKKSNAKRIWKRLEVFRQKYEAGIMSEDQILRSLEGWLAYARFANTYNLRKRVILQYEDYFSKPETNLLSFS